MPLKYYMAVAILLALAANAAAQGSITVVMHEGKSERVRLIGIDAPEGEPGREATNYLRSLLPKGCVVTLEWDCIAGRRDRYRRLLAYVMLDDGRMVNMLLIQEGYAMPYTVYEFERMDEFSKAGGESEKNREIRNPGPPH